MVLWGCPHPWGYLPVSSVPLEEHGFERPVSHPPVHPHHQGEGLIPQRVRDRDPVPVPGPGPPCPSGRLPLRPLCLRRRRRARPAPPPKPSAPAPLSVRGGLAGAGVVGVGGG